MKSPATSRKEVCKFIYTYNKWYFLFFPLPLLFSLIGGSYGSKGLLHWGRPVASVDGPLCLIHWKVQVCWRLGLGWLHLHFHLDGIIILSPLFLNNSSCVEDVKAGRDEHQHHQEYACTQCTDRDRAVVVVGNKNSKNGPSCSCGERRVKMDFFLQSCWLPIGKPNSDVNRSQNTESTPVTRIKAISQTGFWNTLERVT